MKAEINLITIWTNNLLNRNLAWCLNFYLFMFEKGGEV